MLLFNCKRLFLGFCWDLPLWVCCFPVFFPMRLAPSGLWFCRCVGRENVFALKTRNMLISAPLLRTVDTRWQSKGGTFSLGSTRVLLLSLRVVFAMVVVVH